jgi:Asp-tRNA(Asn)/Glu-tRNA(Gln) amidotransferase A subunit family amidase
MPDNRETATAAEIARRVRANGLSPTQGVSAARERVESRNPSLNAFDYVDREERDGAEKRFEDPIFRGDDVEPLAGAPVALKDLYSTQRGWPISNASAILAAMSADDIDATLKLATCDFACVRRRNRNGRDRTHGA